MVSRTGAGQAGRLAGIKAQIAQFCRRPWAGKKREGGAGGGAEGAAAAGGVSSCPDPGRRSGPARSLGAVGARIRSEQRPEIIPSILRVQELPQPGQPGERHGGELAGGGGAGVRPR